MARDRSYQKFDALITGNAPCSGHSECDDTRIACSNDLDAALIHEAAIGKIAGDQITKLLTLGLTEEEAEGADHPGLPEIRTASAPPPRTAAEHKTAMLGDVFFFSVQLLTQKYGIFSEKCSILVPNRGGPRHTGGPGREKRQRRRT